MDLIAKYKEIKKRERELSQMMSQPDTIKDQTLFTRLAKEHAALKEPLSALQRYNDLKEKEKEANDLLKSSDLEMVELAEMELLEIEPALEKLEEDLILLLLPKDPSDEKGVILEIRSGTGGDEAALFAGDLYHMYRRFAETNGWKIEVMNSNPSGVGGFKEIVFSIEGSGVYSKLKYESGVHRVQRVPTTESQGRIHTSAATVAVLPEAEEVEVEVDPQDLRIETFRSSGPGGQHVNTTDSAVRMTHTPTGITVSCQDEKSQHKNRSKALRILRARLLEKMEAEQQKEVDDARKMQVGSGDRSERIRTYNFPQGRVTDHRINFTTHRLTEILGGDLAELTRELSLYDQQERLKQVK